MRARHRSARAIRAQPAGGRSWIAAARRGELTAHAIEEGVERHRAWRGTWCRAESQGTGRLARLAAQPADAVGAHHHRAVGAVDDRQRALIETDDRAHET